jgi:hypothetical protein
MIKPSIEYRTSERDRVCKLCSNLIYKGAKGVVFKNIHVSPKMVDIHFHNECLVYALDLAKNGVKNEH